MKRTLVLLSSLLSLAAGLAAEPPHAALDPKHRTFFKDYCVECHNENKQKGKLRLDDISFALDSVENADRWQKILNQINSGEMPPEESKQPEREAKTEFLDSLSHTLMAARHSLSDSGGKVTMRRLNRREYKNTIRDLLGVDIKVGELPADGGAGTFDTVGSSLFMSSDQFEQYLALGRQALDEHFARTIPVAALAGEQTFKTHIETEVAANKEMAGHLSRLKKDYDRYKQWATAVDAEAAMPENTVLVKELREYPQVKSNPDNFYIQWAKNREKPSPKQFGFPEADLALFFGKTQFDRGNRYFSEYLAMPHKDSGSYLLTYQGHEFEKVTFDTKWPAGTYTLRVRIAALDDAPEQRRFIQFGQHGENIAIFSIMGTYQVTGTMAQPQILEIPVNVTSAGKREFVIREKHAIDRAAMGALWWESFNKTGTGPKPALWIDWMELEGPVNAISGQPVAQSFKKHVEPELESNKRVAGQHQRLGKHFDDFMRWSAAMDAFAQKPEHRQVVANLPQEFNGWRRAIAYYEGVAALPGAPSAKDFGFLDMSSALFDGADTFRNDHPYLDDYLKLPQKDTGSYLTIFKVNPKEVIQADAFWPTGRYTLRIRAAAVEDSPPERRFIEVGHPDPGTRSGQADDPMVISVLKAVQVTGTLAKPQIIEIPVELSLTGSREFVLREKRPNKGDASVEIWREALSKYKTGPKPAIWIDWIELEGPVPANTPALSDIKTPAYRLEPEAVANPECEKMLKQYETTHERFVRWQAGVDKAAASEENQATLAELKKKDPRLNHPESTVLYNYADLLKGAPNAKDFDLGDALSASFGNQRYLNVAPYLRHYLSLPARNQGAYLTLTEGYMRIDMKPPAPIPAGKYLLRLRAGAVKGTPAERHFIEIGLPDEGRIKWNLKTILSSHQITGTVEQPQIVEVPIEVSAATPFELSIRERQPGNFETATAYYFAEKRKNGYGPEPAIWMDYVELSGPIIAGPVASKPIKQRREVELHANAMVGGTYNGYFKGGYEAAKRFLETREPQKGIPDEQEAKFRIRGFEQQGPTFERYLNDPLTKTGSYLTIYNVHTEEVITLPPNQPSGWLKTRHEVEKAEPGEYMLRFRIGAVDGTPKERHFVTLGSRMKPEEREDFTLMQTYQISGTTEAPQVVEVPVSISADGPRTFVLREKRDVKLDHELFIAAQKATGVGPVPALWIDWVEWEGPLVKQAPITKTTHIEPETRRAEVERGHLRYKYLNEQYAKWKAAGGDETNLKDFGFTDKSHAEFAKAVWDGNSLWFQQYLDRPLSKTGLYFDNTVQETSEHAIDLPADIATGDYVMRVKIGRAPDMPAERAFLTFVEASPIDKDDRTFLANRQITATLDQPEVVEVPFKVRPGGPRKFVLFEKRPLKKEGISLPGRTRAITDAKQRDPVLWMDWIEYEGPLQKTGARRSVEPVLFANNAGAKEHDHARDIIAKFATRAFRDKKPAPAYLDKLSTLFDTRRKAGDAFDVAIREPLSAVLASPGFLYLSEPGDEKKPRALTPLELATRLSYFLWSAPPDEPLLALARSRDLVKPEVLAAEVDRMIASEKAGEFVSGFVHQWLGMDRLDFFQFDTKQFRDFDESAKAAARREVYETFAHLLRSNGSLSKLLKSNEIHVNGLLATYYGIDGVTGDDFRPVSLPPNSPRGGLLGMAAVLAMGSNGERSSPVERGAWVLRKLLHDPPPPAPPNVPQITRLNGQPLTTRERLLAHQEEPQCASCHRAIDPIGFGLENFNAAGKWRTEDRFQAVDANGKPNPKLLKTWTIDPAAAFHRGNAFRDYFELRDMIAAKPERFARGFSEALIQYALGRPFGFTDEDLATDIVQSSQQKNFSLRQFIQTLVASKAFHLK